MDKVEVVITYDLDNEDIEIKSGFMNNPEGFKDPIGYTSHLIELALEKWIREKIGITCPECGTELNPEWDYCPKCSWSWRIKNEQPEG